MQKTVTSVLSGGNWKEANELGSSLENQRGSGGAHCSARGSPVSAPQSAQVSVGFCQQKTQAHRCSPQLKSGGAHVHFTALQPDSSLNLDSLQGEAWEPGACPDSGQSAGGQPRRQCRDPQDVANIPAPAPQLTAAGCCLQSGPCGTGAFPGQLWDRQKHPLLQPAPRLSLRFSFGQVHACSRLARRSLFYRLL